MKEILSTVLLTALVVFTAVAPLGMAQSTKQEATKDNQEQRNLLSALKMIKVRFVCLLPDKRK